MAGVSAVHIIYKGSGQAVTALIGNQVQIMFATAPTVTSHIKSGALKGLAVTSAQPSALMPDIPTVASSGLPGYESVLMYVAFAPANTPPAPINRLNQEIVRFVQTPDVKLRLLGAGVESAGSTPQELAATMKTEMVRLGKVIKDAGIRVD
jgi:tripartite-type tricarboxylate transporter receptor subunit TctC